MSLLKTAKQVSERPNKAFTLLEVLLALAVAGLLLTGAMLWITTLADTWLKRDNRDFFHAHVDGATYFLQNLIALSQGLDEDGSARAVWSLPPDDNPPDEPLLTLYIKDSVPFFALGRALSFPGIACYFYLIEDEGLFLLWHSRLLREDEDRPVYRSLVSPFARELAFLYYDFDANDWSEEEEPQQNDDEAYILPDAIRITFAQDDETERTVYLLIPAYALIP